MESIDNYPESTFSETSFKSVMNLVKYLSLGCTLIAFAVGVIIYTNNPRPSDKYVENFKEIYKNPNPTVDKEKGLNY